MQPAVFGNLDIIANDRQHVKWKNGKNQRFFRILGKPGSELPGTFPYTYLVVFTLTPGPMVETTTQDLIY